MRRPLRFSLENLLGATFWMALWFGTFVMAYRMFRLKLPAPITYSLGFALWCLLVAAPIVGLAALLGRTKEGLQLAGLVVLMGMLMAALMALNLLVTLFH
jgi:hypothetical protein